MARREHAARSSKNKGQLPPLVEVIILLDVAMNLWSKDLLKILTGRAGNPPHQTCGGAPL